LRRGLNFEVVVLVLHDGANCRGLQRPQSASRHVETSDLHE
jgi:hypothetical protein